MPVLRNQSIPLVGPTYTNRSLPVNSQVTRNFYIEVNQEGGEPVALMPFYGMKSFGTTGAGVDRGMGEHAGVGYKVTGDTLYSFDSTGTATSIGNIPGTNQCRLRSDGVNLVVTYGAGKPIAYNGSTLTVGTDSDLPNANTITYINRRVVYDGAGSGLVFSDLDAALTVDSANVTSVDTTPDETLAVETQSQQVIVFTAKSITPYYNATSGSTIFLPIQNSTRNVGLKAIHSLARNQNFIYFLGNDLIVYRYAGLQVQAIGNPAIGNAIAGYFSPEDAIGFTFTIENQNFYYLTFPTQESWLFNEAAGWTNLAFGVKGNSHLMNSYVNLYGKHLVADRRNGNIYELDPDTYDDNGETIQRQRDTISINGRSFGKPGATVFMSRLTLVLEPGTSLITGQGSDAEVMMSYSDDNGNSYSVERWEFIGEQGEYGFTISWDGLGSFKNRLFRFKMSDPVKWVLISLHGDVELQIG